VFFGVFGGAQTPREREGSANANDLKPGTYTLYRRHRSVTTTRNRLNEKGPANRPLLTLWAASE
jgi:hypothetical protein